MSGSKREYKKPREGILSKLARRRQNELLQITRLAAWQASWIEEPWVSAGGSRRSGFIFVEWDELCQDHGIRVQDREDDGWFDHESAVGRSYH